MLIFGNGLRIKFWDVRKQRREGIIKHKSNVEEDTYVVSICEIEDEYAEKLTKKICTVHYDQITHVLIKDSVDDHKIWVGIDDLYTAFRDGETINWYTRYHRNLPIHYQQLSTNSLNYVIEDAWKRFLKEDKKMNFLSFEVEHNSIWNSDAMRCRLEFEIDSKEAWKYESLMKRSRDSLQIRQFGESVLSAFLDATNLPKPKKVIFHDPATVVYWEDGTKTVVKRPESVPDDKEKAIMYCVFKKVIGNKSKMDKYIKTFMKEEKKDEEKKEEAGSGELCQCEQGAGESSSEGTV